MEYILEKWSDKNCKKVNCIDKFDAEESAQRGKVVRIASHGQHVSMGVFKTVVMENFGRS